MKPKHIASFLAGFIPTGFILAVILLGIALMTFNLGGGETLQELEVHRTAMLIISLLLVLAAGWAARDFINRQKRFTAYGIRVMALLCLLVVTGNYLYNLALPMEFNKAKWEQPGSQKYHMAATLVKRDTLIGFTKQQVVDLLGSNDGNLAYRTSPDGSLEYSTHHQWLLIVRFENGIVVETELRQPYLGV